MQTPQLIDNTYVLALDTSTDALGVALWQPKSAKSFVFCEGAFRNQSSRLHPKVMDVLAEAGAKIEDIGLIVCTKGPGSFTGVRIGLAAGQGLCKALNVDLVGVSTLKASAKPGSTVWIPAIRGEVYVQKFDKNGQPEADAAVLPISEAAQQLTTEDTLCLCGHVDMPENMPEVEVVKVTIDPLVLAEKGYQQYKEEGAKPVQPIYLSQLRYRKKDDI